jgi:hypothetical protein
MVEMRITKEIGNYKPRVVGPLTFRQLVCVGIAAPACYLIYKYLSPHITRDLAGFFCILPAAVAGLFGWVHPYGMNTEAFIRSVFINIFLAPSHRKYKTKNQFELLAEKLSDEGNAEANTASAEEPSPRKSKKAHKYKRSKLAIK